MEPQHIVSIDEHHSRKVVIIEDQPGITREQRFRRLMEAGDQTGEVKAAKIQKVIFLLRDHKCFIKFFEPRVASLGPIHHGNPKYKLGEGYKLILARKFVEGSGKIIELLYKEAEMAIKQLRECFEEEVTKKYDDEALAWMLFVDGCAILEYIFCAANNEFKELNIKNDSASFAHQDLFLLENQVPYRLLNLLMSLSGKAEELRKSIEIFIGNVTNQQRRAIETEPTHLLDLLRTTLLGPPRSPRPTRSRQVDDPNWQSYRNVQELKASGIRLKCSKSSCLRDICFSRRFGFYPGYLSLPPITLDDSAGPKFMNLIAYEMCLDFENDFAITSYISFLDSLIDEANDVKDLRKARILHNFLGSDKEVADLFNEIGTDLVPSTEAYKDVKFQIQEYYDNNCMTLMAQFFHDRFSAPWTILAFLGVLLGLVLTAVQTWLAAFPDPGKKS